MPVAATVPSRRLTRRSLCLLAAACGTAALAAGPATTPVTPPAAAPPATDAPAKAAAVASVWVGSEDAVKAAAAQVGFPLPPMVSLSVLPQIVPVLHAGDLRTDAPVGAVFIAGDDLGQQQSAAFALPVRAGTVPLSGIPNAEKTDAADTVDMGGVPVRRTADYVVLGGSAPVTAKLDVEPRAAAMTPAPGGGRTPLVWLAVDLAAWRVAAPEQFAAAMDKVAAPGQTEANAGQKAGADWFAGVVRDKLDTFSLTVEQTRDPAGDDGWTATATVEPFPVVRATHAKPGLPADCVARADVHLSGEALSGWLKPMLDQAQDATPAENAVGMKMLNACFLGDAETFGLGVTGGRPVIYCVTQRDHGGGGGTDLAADMASLDKDAVALGHGGADFRPVPYTAADGKPVYRFTVHDHDAPMGYVDVGERGGKRYATYCPGDVHLVDALTPLPADGTFDTLGTGWVQVGGTIDVLTALSPPAPGPAADRLRQLSKLFGPARVAWAAKPAGRGAAFVAELPGPVLKAIGPAVQLFRD